MRFSRSSWVLRGALLSACVALACGGSDSGEEAIGDSPEFPGGSSRDAGAGAGFGGGGAPGGTIGGTSNAGGGTAGGQTPVPVLAPEKEVEVRFEAPQAGKTTVYVPNPGTNRVAAVNATTFSVETLSSGLAPTYAATVPGQDIAIVLNVGSGDASILRTSDGKTSVRRIPIGHDQNAIAIAPDGLHALVYFDARLSTKLAASFQDVSVLNLATPGKESVRGVSVGFRPRNVQFSRDNQRAFVVTEDGVSIVDLAATDTGPTIANLVPVGDKVGEAVSLDVQIVPDGTLAVARREGDPHLRLIDLRSGDIKTLAFDTLQAPPPPAPVDAGVDAGDAGATPTDAGAGDAGNDAGSDGGGLPLPFGPLELTDLDLAGDGSYALAVLRNASALLRIPLPGGFDDPSKISVHRVEVPFLGSVSVSEQGNVAALYATAAPVEALVLVDLANDFTQRAVRLRKAVRAVALSNDGSRALVLHQKTGAATAGNDEARIDASEGYSLVEVTRGIAKLQLTNVAPLDRDILLAPDASRLFILLRDPSKGHSVEVADLRSFQVTTQALAKPPSSLGLLPGARRLFVGQQSEGGMITFLDVESGDIVQAVSGFELSGRVRQ